MQGLGKIPGPRILGRLRRRGCQARLQELRCRGNGAQDDIAFRKIKNPKKSNRAYRTRMRDKGIQKSQGINTQPLPEHLKKRDENRNLNQEQDAAGKRVYAPLGIQRHHGSAMRLFVPLMPLLNFFNLRLEACKRVLEAFDGIVPNFYDEADRDRGAIISTDRQGEVRTFPLMALSIAVVFNTDGRLKHYGEASAIAMGLKKKAKENVKSCYVLDRRAQD